MGVIHGYPYTNFHDLNLDWILQKMGEFSDKLENFISLATIKYANPLLWDITSQYETNTVVIDKNGNAYLSVQPVPSGVSLERTEYWTKIGNFDELWGSIKSAITPFDEKLKTTASADRGINTLVWLDNKLYRVTQYMQIGTEYVPGTNCVSTSMNEVFSYILGLDHAKYEDDTESLILGFFEDTQKLVVAGDTHEYNPATQTIKIIGR